MAAAGVLSVAAASRRALASAAAATAATAVQQQLSRPWSLPVANCRQPCYSSSSSAGVPYGTPPPAAAAASQPSSSSCPAEGLRQRYAGMLAAGVLRPDAQQELLVGQLCGLLHQLQDYRGALTQHRSACSAYEERYQQRLRELELQDSLQQQEQQQQAPAQPDSSSSWLQQAFSSLLPGSQAAAAQKQLTPQQRARRAASARAARVTQELGPGPVAPAAPQGLYIYGSVGSGKSLLMDLFYDHAQSLQLDHARRLHFNAAMLEIHRRLHHQDVQRQQRSLRRRQQEEARANALGAAAAAAAADTTSSGSSSSSSSDATAAVSAAAAQDAHAADEHAEEEEEEEDQHESAADGRIVSAWFDDAVWQQKEAKAAVLAIRRHLRASRAGNVPAARLAAANAAVMSAAARSFIRASGPDPTSGWGDSSSSKGGGGGGGGDRLAALLCFDEMQIADVWSAAALKALLEALTAEGCVVVTTSNRHPAELPRHGLHEAMFGHLLNTLFSSCRLFELSAAADYRRLSLAGAATQLMQQPLPLLPADAAAVSGAASNSSSSSSCGVATDRVYFWPLGAAAEAALQQKWAQELGQQQQQQDAANSSQQQELAVMFGRRLSVPRAAAGAAWFEFDELCGRPLGSADYLALAHSFHTLFLSGVPAMSFNNRDRARRFISLVDELYNNRVRLVCSAALPPDQLFSDSHGGSETPLLDLEGLQFEGAVEGSKLRTDLMADGGVAPVAASAATAAETAALLGGAEERFAFARAVSRLYEMSSASWVAARRGSGLA